MAAAPPLLRIPPFPGHRGKPLAAPGRADVPAEAAAALVTARVGGSFWAAQPELGEGDGVLLAPDDAAQLRAMLAELGERPACVLGGAARREGAALRRLSGPCDPWWLARHAAEVWAGAGQELALIAGLCGTPLRVFGSGAYASSASDPAGLAARLLGAWQWRDPFDGAPVALAQLIAQLAEWRALIDANRTIAAVHGVAGWKRVTVDPLLWGGSGRVPHTRRPASVPGALAVVWRSRTPARLAGALAAAGTPVAEIEDGFIRSVGLGANCVPPLSVIVDRAGIYFDAGGPSDLERLLEQAEIAPSLLARAAALRETIVREAVAKYAQGGAAGHLPARGAAGRRRILVTGQVEDDRSILTGGAGMSNLEVLARTRAMEGDAWIIYKPHPDVEAGHRKGHVATADAMRLADEIAHDAPILPLIDSVDGVHVITSLAGFEALLRGKAVTTHGLPFYAGWGLTRDCAPPLARRTRRRTLDEVVAATLLLYPRYADPVTRLPCGPERVIARMAAGQAQARSALVTLRTWQGRIKRAGAGLVEGLTGGWR